MCAGNTACGCRAMSALISASASEDMGTLPPGVVYVAQPEIAASAIAVTVNPSMRSAFDAHANSESIVQASQYTMT